MVGPGNASTQTAWDKLRHRKVVQWGLAYVAVAWGILQGLEFAVSTFGWLPAITRAAAVAAVAGLPITVVLAWFHGDRGDQRATRVELAILGVLLAGGAFAVQHTIRAPVALTSLPAPTAGTLPSTAPDRRRIAILPFANLGADPANVAFAGGVHDTLITQIAKIPGLSVISRSSVLQFADKHPTIKEVAIALGVGTVLEGSVERDGHRLRIQAQLIDAATDAHLWAETYDRNADDLFAVQSEIAQAVAEQLRIRLTSDDSQRLAASLTSKPAAYERYAVGRNFVSRGRWPEAIQEFTAAVTVDPDFAAAHAQLSLSRTWLAFLDMRQRKELLPLARAAADRALELDPTLPEAHLALAVYFYRGDQDIDRATSEFERAVAGLPNDAVAHLNFGYLRRWQGRWEEAAALFGRAADLDPRGEAAKPHIMALVTLGRRDEALRAIAAASAAQPDDVDLAIWPGSVAQNFSCDLATTERVLREVATKFPGAPELLHEDWYLALQTGDAAAAVDAVERLSRITGPPDESLPLQRGLAYRLAGRRADAKRNLRESLQSQLRELRRIPAGDLQTDTLSLIALHYALLGDRRLAIEYANRAVALIPPAGDGANRTDVLLTSAAALVQAGDSVAAVDRTRQVLDSPGWAKSGWIWCDPLMAPLRANASFRKMMEEHGADVRIDPYRRETWPRSPSERLNPGT